MDKDKRRYPHNISKQGGQKCNCFLLHILGTMSKNNKKKIKLFIDADDTILNSSKTFIDIVNEEENIFPPKIQDELKDWKYRSLFPYMTTERIIEIYDSEKFFNIVKVDSDFEKFYLKHENDFEWNIVTKGHKTNIEHKIKYFKKHLPKAKVVGCLFDSVEEQCFSKSHINMDYGIQIDDRVDSLVGTNANIKILLKNNRDFYWNREDSTNEPLYIMNNWKEIIDTLEFALKNPDVFMERV